MSNLIKIAEIAELKPGECKTVSANGCDIALCNVDGKFFALDNTCPHHGGPLGEGFLNGKTVTCPWHGWSFNVCTGESPVMSGLKQKTYECVVEGNDVKVKLE